MSTTAQQIAELQKQNNEMYIQSAREQMSFQREMSNTAHSREVKDLISAGLNPVLSATGGQGATTPNGAQADVDSSSMVNYLLTEMNNENARAMNSAQVAAQKYAAEMAYKAAQVSANAQIRASEISAGGNPLVWVTNALSDPGSPQAQAARVVLDWLGIKLPKNATELVPDIISDTLSGVRNVISEQKAINFFQSSIVRIAMNKPEMDYLKAKSQTIIDFYRQLGYNKLATMFQNWIYNSSAK